MRPTHVYLCFILVTAMAGCSGNIKYSEGGYDYPKTYSAKDARFYFYPLRDQYSRKDSFRMAQQFFFYQFLHEPNLSIKSLGYGIFRLTYGIGYDYYCITVTENEITVKKSVSEFVDFCLSLTTAPGEIKPDADRFLQHCIDRFYPFDTAKKSPATRHLIDSMMRIYPRLADPEFCWQTVYNKMLPTQNMKFEMIKIPFTKAKFKALATLINEAGYWQMPYETDCDPASTEGWGVTLEANTPKKYNYVERQDCIHYSATDRGFLKACRQIVKYAKLKNEILLNDD